MKEKVLITGARGSVAKKLSYLLDKEKYSIIYLTTNKKSQKNNEFYWNLHDKKIDPLALRNVNHIIHLSGYSITHSWTSKNKKRMFESRVNTAKLIYNECYKMNIKPQTFITASAMGYYGFESVGMKKENDTAGQDWMAQLCVEWEKTADKFKSFGARVIKLRLSLVLDKDSGVLNKILLGYKFGIGVVFGNGTQPFPWIHIEDVSRFIIFSMKEENIIGTFNIAAPENISYYEMVNTIKQQKVKKAILLYLPKFLIKLLFPRQHVLLLNMIQLDTDKLNKTGFKFMFNNINEVVNLEID